MKFPVVLLLAAQLSEVDEFLAMHSNRKIDGYYSFNSVRFTLSTEDEYDFIAVFNTIPKNKVYTFPSKKIIFFMMEPGIKPFHSFMYGLENKKVHLFSPVHSRTASHGFLGWSIPKSVGELFNENPIEKTNCCSAISSKTIILPGHYQRLTYLTYLAKSNISFDLFGRGFKTMQNKLEALIPYQYSITIENGAIPHYFTEKINDALLCWTIPFYVGAPNIHSYFPEEAVVHLPENDPKLGAEIISSVLQDSTDYSKRIDALHEARKRIIEDYNPLAKIAQVVNEQDLDAAHFDMLTLENKDIPVWKRRLFSNYLMVKHQLKIKAKTDVDFGLLASKIPR